MEENTSKFPQPKQLFNNATQCQAFLCVLSSWESQSSATRQEGTYMLNSMRINPYHHHSIGRSRDPDSGSELRSESRRVTKIQRKATLKLTNSKWIVTSNQVLDAVNLLSIILIETVFLVNFENVYQPRQRMWVFNTWEEDPDINLYVVKKFKNGHKRRNKT